MSKSDNSNGCKVVTDIQLESPVSYIVFHPTLPFLATTICGKTKLWNCTDPQKPIHLIDLVLHNHIENANSIVFHSSLPLLAIDSFNKVYLCDCTKPQNPIFITVEIKKLSSLKSSME